VKRAIQNVAKLAVPAVMLAFVSVSAGTMADDCLLTNLYARAHMIFVSGDGDLSKSDSRFDCVRHGGMLNELEDHEWQSFSNLCTIVSNCYPTILQNWEKYHTNEVVRFSVLNAVAFSGECVYTNFFERFVANFTPPNDSDMESLRYLVAPFGTPMEQQVAMKYDDPVISNLLSRIVILAETHGDTNLVISCRQRISGCVKQYMLENR